MRMPEVSVVMPVYNGEKYIRQAIESVFIQDVSLELLVIDDGSWDGTAGILKEYEGRENFRYFRNSSNLGAAGSRNRGVREARGRYIAFLDADDWWAPTFLEEMMGLVKEYPEAGIYASNYWYYKPGKTHVAVKKVYSVECTVYED